MRNCFSWQLQQARSMKCTYESWLVIDYIFSIYIFAGKARRPHVHCTSTSVDQMNKYDRIKSEKFTKLSFALAKQTTGRNAVGFTNKARTSKSWCCRFGTVNVFWCFCFRFLSHYMYRCTIENTYSHPSSFFHNHHLFLTLSITMGVWSISRLDFSFILFYSFSLCYRFFSSRTISNGSPKIHASYL